MTKSSVPCPVNVTVRPSTAGFGLAESMTAVTVSGGGPDPATLQLHPVVGHEHRPNVADGDSLAARQTIARSPAWLGESPLSRYRHRPSASAPPSPTAHPAVALESPTAFSVREVPEPTRPSPTSNRRPRCGTCADRARDHANARVHERDSSQLRRSAERLPVPRAATIRGRIDSGHNWAGSRCEQLRIVVDADGPTVGRCPKVDSQKLTLANLVLVAQAVVGQIRTAGIRPGFGAPIGPTCGRPPDLFAHLGTGLRARCRPLDMPSKGYRVPQRPR